MADSNIERTSMGTLFNGNVRSFLSSVVDIRPKKGFFDFFPGVAEPFKSVQRGDEYSFSVLSTSTVNLSLSHRNRKGGGDADLRLFRDDDRDGRLDVPVEPVIDASLRGDGRDEFISRQIPAGDYIVGVVLATGRNTEADYSLRVSIDGAAPIKIQPVPTIPRIPTGKVAAQQGGVLNGRNTAGTLVGLAGKDIIHANNGDDIVLGGGNDDVLNGGNGNDTLFGGKGNDSLNGGTGDDLFVIAPKNGLDTIADLRVGKDRIGLGGNLRFEDLSFVQSAKGALVKAGNQQLAFFNGVQANQLQNAANFTPVDLAQLSEAANVLLKT